MIYFSNDHILNAHCAMPTRIPGCLYKYSYRCIGASDKIFDQPIFLNSIPTTPVRDISHNVNSQRKKY